MKRICVLTRIRNDEFFLRKWIAYYGLLFGEENLYVYLDGRDQPVPTENPKVNIFSCDRIEGGIVETDRKRLQFLSDRAKEHFDNGYELVIGCDVDEFLAVDPALGVSLGDYISSLKINTSLSGLGIDVGQHLVEESVIDPERPYLEQRKYAVLSHKYTKPVLISKPVMWGSGFHRVKGHNYKIDPNLYLFHFGSFDMHLIESRFHDKDRMAMGFKNHIQRRTKTITWVTYKKALHGDETIKWARTLQTYCRHIFAWNKPSMLFFNTVIEIPERFSKVM